MTQITLDDAIVEQLEGIAQREQRSVNDVLRSLLESYTIPDDSQLSPDEAFNLMNGMFDDDITDLSVTVRETMREYYRKKYADPD